MVQTIIIEKDFDIDSIAWDISDKYITWESSRAEQVSEWKEIQEYLFATDTTKTANSKLPWSNKTTMPKLCQIRDNLFANYMSSMFPKKKWLTWQGDTSSDEDIAKKISIESYISWVIDRNEFYDEVSKLVLDYIDYGNVFGMVTWVDNSQLLDKNPELSDTFSPD